MQRSASITVPQLKAIQVLFSQLHRASLDSVGTDERESRLKLFSQVCGRSIGSTKDLSRAGAFDLIDQLKLSVGQKPNPFTRPRDRSAARAAGTHGRHGVRTNELAVASASDHARISEAVQRLGWDHDRFTAWLASPSSPLGRAGTLIEIRTVGQANKVWWALKRMLKASGQWR